MAIVETLEYFQRVEPVTVSVSVSSELRVISVDDTCSAYLAHKQSSCFIKYAKKPAQQSSGRINRSYQPGFLAQTALARI
jgi:hypothetical protein